MKNNASEIKNTCRINSLIISGSAKNFVFILYPTYQINDIIGAIQQSVIVEKMESVCYPKSLRMIPLFSLKQSKFPETLLGHLGETRPSIATNPE
jgi:hypothetical protein